MSTRLNILITCAGSGVGQSVVDSLKHDKAQYWLLASDRNRYSYSIPDCDAFVELPAISDPGYLDALFAACIEYSIDVVIPGHDLELTLVAENEERFREAGVEVMVSDSELVHLLRDKHAWAQAFRARTDRVVDAILVSDLLDGNAASMTYPAIAKPSGGSASSGLKILLDAGDLDGVARDFILQPFLFPADDDDDLEEIRTAVAAKRVVQISEISVQLVYSRDSRLLGHFASRNRLKAGVPVVIEPVDDPLVWSAVDEIVRILGDYRPRGPINLQGRLTEDGLVFFEMNPRFTGITGNRAQFGFNEVSLLVDNFVHGSERELFFNPNKVGVRQVACRAWPRERYSFNAERTGVKHILVLGGTSWLAGHFMASRLRAGDEVVAVCREQSVEDARSRLAGIRVVSLDSRDLPGLFGWADVVVNCLSGRPPSGAENIAQAHVIQMELLDLAAVGDVARLVNLSSQSIYAADTEFPKTEDSPLDLSGSYAFSKYSIEQTVRSLARRNPALSAVSLRLGRLFGAAEGMRDTEFPHRVVSSACNGESLTVSRPGTVMDLLDIHDAVDAVSFFVDDPGIWRGEAFNIGSGHPVTVEEYVSACDTVARNLNKSLDYSTDTEPPAVCSGLDCNRAASLGWKPSSTLTASIEQLFEHYSNV